MGKLKKILISILTGIFILLFFITSLGDYKNFRRDIYYKHNSKISIKYLLGFIPDKYKQDYDERVLENNEKFELINVIFNKSPNDYYNYIIYNNKVSNNYVFLKDSDLMFYRTTNNKDILSLQLNISSLNELIDIKNIKNHDSIKKLYCYFSSNLKENAYKIIYNEEDFSKLKSILKSNSISEIKKETIVVPSIILNYDKYTYCWFENFGLFEIQINIENENIKLTSDKFIGYLRDEDK